MSNLDQPLVSVIVPAYNHENFVTQCLDSVFEQTYSRLELLIINDGSKDNTHSVIQRWIENRHSRFERLNYINQENKGVTVTLNEALKWTKGKYFSAFASDDIILPNKISLLVQDLEEKGAEIAASFGNAKFIDFHDSPISLDIVDDANKTLGSYDTFLEYYTFNRQFNFKDPEVFGTYASLLSGNYLPAMSCVVRTEYLRDAGGWSEKNAVEDWEMWLKLSKKYKFSYIDESVALYRWHPNNTSKINRTRILNDSIKLLENEKRFALNNNLSHLFFPIYLYNIKLLKEINNIHYGLKLGRLFLNSNFWGYAFAKFKRSIYG